MKTLIEILGWWTLPLVLFGLYYITWTITYLILMCIDIRNGETANQVRAMKRFFIHSIYKKKVEIVGDIVLIFLACIGILFWVVYVIFLLVCTIIGGFIPFFNNLLASFAYATDPAGRNVYLFPEGHYLKTPIIKFWIWLFWKIVNGSVYILELRLKLEKTE
jgi:hypothetical protein